MADESRIYSFDFALVEEVVEGDLLSASSEYPTLTAAPEDELVIGEVSIDGTQVKALISGGVAGTTYTLTCLVETGSGKRLGGQAALEIL